MAEITLPPNWHDGGKSRLSRGVMATARAGWAAVKVLAYASMGAGTAVGGASMVASGANILTSSDQVLLMMGVAAPSEPGLVVTTENFAAGYAKARGSLSTRSEPQPPPTPEESVCLTRWEALLTFGLGILVALFSLVGFAAAWSETTEALGFYPYGQMPKKELDNE